MTGEESTVDTLVTDPIRLFSDYLKITGVVRTAADPGDSLPLEGKRLGMLNGSSWITLWSTYFARLFLPGVQLLNMGNDAVQLNFMKAHEAHQECPPPANVERFVQYARDLVELGGVDAVLITCSTMNRGHKRVADALAPSGVPVVQIDEPMMEAAVDFPGGILVVATHGPTVTSTHTLLDEAAARRGKHLIKDGLVVESAWRELGRGNVVGHNQALATAIRGKLRERSYRCVVLAQLSMASLLFTFPDPLREFGLPVLTSAQCGFQRVREILIGGS
jgi:aspartate/glutamate racemase